jgi:hypothetical protein
MAKAAAPKSLAHVLGAGNATELVDYLPVLDVQLSINNKLIDILLFAQIVGPLLHRKFINVNNTTSYSLVVPIV